MPQMGLLAWLDKKIVDPLYQILRRGLEPKQLAFSTALGIALGIFPICGVTVLLCGLAIALLGSLCHAPTVLLANFIATPVELRYFCFLPGHGTLLGWLVAAPFILAALYIIFLPCFKVLVHKFSTVQSSPMKPSNSLAEISLRSGDSNTALSPEVQLYACFWMKLSPGQSETRSKVPRDLKRLAQKLGRGVGLISSPQF
ncbi:hypothetical protein NC651_008101 [Populus alba x Populus x berolinensis]|nr:hypothetical protein NC651_008101 [Populus alba x Populus x berolinensis]